MEIGGCDVIFDSKLTFDQIAAIVNTRWQDHVTELLTKNEMAFYENKASLDSWDAGAVEGNMILVIKNDDLMTCVGSNDEEMALIDEIKKAS